MELKSLAKLKEIMPQLRERHWQFAYSLRTLAKTCNFGTVNDSLIRDRLICGIHDDSLRERMLRREDLTLDKALTMGRIAENTSSQLTSLKNENAIEINQTTKATPVDYVKRKGNTSSLLQNCFFCKRSHLRRKCPAYGANCNKCGQQNHFEGSEACKRNRRNINVVDVNENATEVEDENTFFIGCIENENREAWTVDL